MRTYIIYDKQNELYYTGQSYPESWSKDKDHAYEFEYKENAEHVLSSEFIQPGIYEILKVNKK